MTPGLPVSGRRTALRLVAALAVVGLVAVVALEARRRAGLYWYDVREDYRWSFGGEAVTTTSIDLGPDGFAWPEVPGEWRTAYLRLTVRSSFAGRWFEPSVEVREPEGAVHRQTFERGVRGIRYVEVGVGGGGRAAGARVGLDGRHLRWAEPRAELVTFASPSPDGRSILVVAPHPDDAEIAAFGLYSGRDAWVVTVTAGDYVDGRYAHLAPTEEAQDDLRGRVRAWDSVVVPLWGGVQPANAVQLGYPNGSLETLRERALPETARRIERFRRFNAAPEFRGRPVDPTWDGLVEDLVAVLRAAAPEIVVLPHPALDDNREHALATFAVFDALDRAGIGDGWLFLYTNHLVHGEHYPFGPAGARATLPPWFDPELPVATVLSLPLDEARRVDKAFALEAMHDLRAAPSTIEGDGPVRRGLDRVARAWREVLRDPAGTYDYLRRAARPNEIFLIAPFADRDALRAHAVRTRFAVGEAGRSPVYRGAAGARP